MTRFYIIPITYILNIPRQYKIDCESFIFCEQSLKVTNHPFMHTYNLLINIFFIFSELSKSIHSDTNESLYFAWRLYGLHHARRHF